MSKPDYHNLMKETSRMVLDKVDVDIKDLENINKELKRNRTGDD